MRDVSDTNTRIYMAIGTKSATFIISLIYVQFLENRFRSSLDVFQALVNEHFASKKVCYILSVIISMLMGLLDSS